MINVLKKVPILLLTIIAVVWLINEDVVQVEASNEITSVGDIVAAGEYTINSASGLEALADRVNGGSGLSGFTFSLTADIDLSGLNWIPIGSDTAFEGTFNGSGFTISNLKISGSGRQNTSNNGLFGLTSGAMITNFTLDNAEVGDITPTVAVGSGAGAVVGRMNNSTLSGVTLSGVIDVISQENSGGLVGHLYSSGFGNQSQINNITVTASGIRVEGTEHVGGFVGQVDQSDDGVSVVSGVIITANTIGLRGTNEIGGFVGENEGVIRGVQITATTSISVFSTSTSTDLYEAGGFVGYNDGSSSQILNSSLSTSGLFITGNSEIGGVAGENEGEINEVHLTTTTIDLVAAGSEAAGFVGFNDGSSSQILNSSLTTSGLVISGSNEVGGIAGENEGVISGVHLTARTINLTATITDFDSEVGGFIGYSNGGTAFNNTLIASGISLSGLNDYIGGFVGDSDSSSSVQSGLMIFDRLDIIGNSGLGGFAGSASSGIRDITMSGTILTLSGVRDIGGFVGDNNQGSIFGVSVDIDEVSLTGLNHIGGFAGFSDGDIKLNSLDFNLLTISGLDALGGYIGFVETVALTQSGVAKISTLRITGNNEIGGYVGRLNEELLNPTLEIDEIVLSGVETLGGFVGYQSGVAPISDAKFSLGYGQIHVTSGIIGGFIGHQNTDISDSWFTVFVNQGLTYDVLGLSPRTTGSVISLPATTTERVNQLLEGEAPTYYAAFVGKYSSGLITLIEEPPRQTLPDPEVTAPPSSGTGYSSQGTPVLRPLVSELFIEVDDVVMEYGEIIELPTAVAYELFGFTRTDLSDQVVRSGSAGPGVGVYPITYTVTYEGVTLSKSIEVRIVDTVAPEIVYTGVNEVYVNDEFEPTFETSDNAPGVVTVEIEELPNITLVGSTQLIAVATDASGNQTRIVVPITVLQERIEVQEVRVNQANLLFVLNSKEIDIDSTTFYTVVAETQPSVTSASWMPYTSQTYEATAANQFVFVKAKDANGTVLLGSPVPLSYQAPAVRLDPVLPAEPVLSPDSNGGLLGVLALGGAAVAGLGVLYWQRNNITKFGRRYVQANQYETRRYGLLSSFFLLLGIRREYDVLFYDGDNLVSEQRVKRGKSAEAPFDANWDKPFDDVKEDLIIHRVK